MVLTEEKTPNFHDVATRVKINPETYLKFESGEMVTLQNAFCEQGVSIKYDIMLILYPMVHWVTVGELIEGWPPEDQEKIKDHLAMLYASKIVVVDESEIQEKPQSDLPMNIGNNLHFNVENHVVMLRDSIRMAAYRQAINNVVHDDSVVMDLGSGSGILSFFSAKAGAKQVYSIEKRPDMVMLAKELSKANGFDDRIEFIEGSSNHIQSEHFDPKPSVLVAEILGSAILEEHVLEFTIDARERFLAPGAELIPHALEILAVAFDSPLVTDKSQDIAELEDIYNLDFDMLKKVLKQKPNLKLERFNPQSNKLMSEPVSITTLDLYTIQSPMFKQNFEFTATQDGHVNGFCLYFKAHLDKTTVLTNSPWAPPTHWTQMVYIFPHRKSVKSGDTVSMELLFDGSLHLWFHEEDTKGA